MAAPVADHVFTEGVDPRKQGYCVRCGRPPGVHERSLTATPLARNLAWEEEFYDNLVRTVSERAGMDAVPLVELTQHRMGAIGANQYGDSAFLRDERDLIAELREENADVIAYVVMEMQKMLIRSEDDPSVASHLFEAGVYACIADAHARAAKVCRSKQRSPLG